jgi:hypothetical protein
MFIVYLLTLKSIPLFVWTFVCISDVSDVSIDFEDYSAISTISIDFCSLFLCL